MTALGRPSRFKRTGHAIAIGLSMGLHAVVLALVGRLDGPAPISVDPSAPPVVWLGEWRPPQSDLPPEIPVETRPEPTPPEPAAVTEAEAVPAQPQAQEAADEAPAVAEKTAEPSPPPTETPTATSPADIDWDAARQQTVAAITAALERESGRITFSAGDGDDDADGLRPAPGAIFDAPRSPRRQMLSPGRARTRVGRFAAELCNALTGGFGLGGILSPLGITMCADEAIYGTYFAHLKPDYMRKRPVCEEPESLDPLMAEISRQNGIPTIKCRLVYADEIEELGYPLAPTPETQARE